MITVDTGGHWPDEVRRIFDDLPDWFGMPESNDEYVEKASTLTNVVARDGDKVVGICLLIRHNQLAAEIDLIAVPESRHRHGIGRRILEHVERELDADGVCMLHVGARTPVPHPREATRLIGSACPPGFCGIALTIREDGAGRSGRDSVVHGTSIPPRTEPSESAVPQHMSTVTALEVAAGTTALLLPATSWQDLGSLWTAVLAAPAASAFVAAWMSARHTRRWLVPVSAATAWIWTVLLLPAWGAGLFFAPGAVLASVATVTQRRGRGSGLV